MCTEGDIENEQLTVIQPTVALAVLYLYVFLCSITMYDNFSATPRQTEIPYRTRMKMF